MERLSERFLYYCGILVGTGMVINIDDLAHIQGLIDAEEQGLLLKLPCKVGDVVYRILDNVYKFVVTCIYIYEDKVLISMDCVEMGCNDWGVTTDSNKIGKLFFLTREEAEAKLKEMEGES